MSSSSLSVLLLSLLFALVAISFVTAVPPHFADFHPQRDSVQYGLVVRNGDKNVDKTSTKEKFSVLTMAEINLFKLNSFVRATCWFNNSLNQIGWNFIHVTGDKNLLASNRTSLAYYYAGVLEGSLTVTHILDLHREKILKNRRRFIRKSPTSSPAPSSDNKAAVWVQNQIAYNRKQIAANPTDPFWMQVGNQFSQMQGLADGASSALFNFTFFDIYSINLDAEWTAIQKHVNEQYLVPDSKDTADFKEYQPSHCSALFRITDDKQIFQSHVTWSPYSIMIRYYKTYEFQTKITFSSYPAFIASADDWLTTSNELTALETTNGIYNNSLYRYVVPETVSEFNRNMVANFLASDCFTWAKMFSYNNSGTYDNSWFCFDAKVFDPASSSELNVPKGLLVISEQIPGLVATLDISDVLLRQGYFGSYNIPYQKVIHQLSGFTRMEQQYGNFFSYEKTNRALIFQQYAPKVQDLRSFQDLMRWNDFQVSSLSLIENCSGCGSANNKNNNNNINQCNPKSSPMLAIASRGDLGVNASAPGVCLGPLAGYLGHQLFGALDCKVAAYSNRSSMTTTAISGPTNLQQPTFEFSDKDWIPIMPKKWNFPWVTFYQV